MKKEISNFIEEKQKLYLDFVEIYTKSMKENRSIQYLFFSYSYTVFYPNTSFDLKVLEEVIKFNSNEKWIQLFDSEYIGFKKATIDYFNPEGNTVLSDEENEIAKKNYTLFKNEVIDDFYLNINNENSFKQIAQFEELDYKGKEQAVGRNIIYTQEFPSVNNLKQFKPLHINNWLTFYDKIFELYFHEFKTVKKNSSLIIYEKQIDAQVSIQVEIDKKRLVMGFKTDDITIPDLKISLVVNQENHRIFYYIPYINPSICGTYEDIEYMKRWSFFVISSYLKLHSEILNLIITEKK